MSHPAPGPYELASTYLRLRSDATVEPLPVNESFWPRIMKGELGTFHHECRMLFITAGEGTQHRPA